MAEAFLQQFGKLEGLHGGQECLSQFTLNVGPPLQLKLRVQPLCMLESITDRRIFGGLDPLLKPVTKASVVAVEGRIVPSPTFLHDRGTAEADASAAGHAHGAEICGLRRKGELFKTLEKHIGDAVPR